MQTLKKVSSNRIARLSVSAILLLIGIAAATAAPGLFDSHSGHKTIVIAHRGANRFAPQNTIPATEKAIEMKLDFVEIDVRTTKDGALVLMHNSTVDAMTDGKDAVRDLTLAEIKKLDAGAKFYKPEFKGARIPTLEELLAAAKGRINIYLDWKDADPKALLKALEQADMIDSTVIYGGPTELLALQKIEPRVHPMPEIGDGSQLQAILKSGLKFDVAATTFTEFSSETAERAHAAGVKVFVDILGPSESCAGVKKAIRRGADAVQTDQPDMVLRCLDSIERPAPGGSK